MSQIKAVPSDTVDYKLMVELLKARARNVAIPGVYLFTRDAVAMFRSENAILERVAGFKVES